MPKPSLNDISIPYAPVRVEERVYIVTCSCGTEFAAHLGSTEASFAAAIRTADSDYAAHITAGHK